MRDRDQIALDDVSDTNLRNDHTFTINTSYDLHWATLKYIGGYSQYDFTSKTDADGTARAFLTSPGGRQVPSYYQTDVLQQKKWYSHELILSSPDQQRLRWVVGLYDYSERYATSFAVEDPLATYLANPVYSATTLAPAPANPTYAFYSQQKHLRTDSQAVYGQLDFDLTSEFRLTGALRYNWDQRYGSNGVRQIFDLYGIYGDYGVPKVGLDVTPNPSSAAASREYNDWSGKSAPSTIPTRA